MEQDRFQELVLQQLQSLAEGQKNIQKDVTTLKGDVQSIRDSQARIEEGVSL
ncbi:MAG TPA: hypothetical protein GXX25_03330 [Desulfotomaculum sp.]|uniref:hypothetical protein n=1 Tax=Desulfofundulus thermobenzoicus TaxID=29376 RepID=UPI00128F9333|nr:hypothetical protein [Desulfofundulus thermobenzoicus]HHW42837.1 hypothetical protein [Desulfotomaculum sp.]